MFDALSIDPKSIAMIHGDAGALLSIAKEREAVQNCVDAVLNFFSVDGTLIVPTFTYSATKSQPYNAMSTPSSIGTFSEMFRVNKRMKRTKHPNFSVSVTGRMTKEVLETRVDDAFGPGTIFDLLYQEDAELITIGCSINALTFTHYVEQQKLVSYRYIKSFIAQIEDFEILRNFETTYYVRRLDLNFDSTTDLANFRNRAIQSGHLRVTKFGRFEFTAIKARDCFFIMSEMLSENPRALVRG